MTLVGSLEWLRKEAHVADDLVYADVEDLAYSARRELEWLNEHMASILETPEKSDLTTLMQTPGKFRPVLSPNKRPMNTIRELGISEPAINRLPMKIVEDENVAPHVLSAATMARKSTESRVNWLDQVARASPSPTRERKVASPEVSKVPAASPIHSAPTTDAKVSVLVREEWSQHEAAATSTPRPTLPALPATQTKSAVHVNTFIPATSAIDNDALSESESSFVAISRSIRKPPPVVVDVAGVDLERSGVVLPEPEPVALTSESRTIKEAAASEIEKHTAVLLPADDDAEDSDSSSSSSPVSTSTFGFAALPSREPLTNKSISKLVISPRASDALSSLSDQSAFASARQSAVLSPPPVHNIPISAFAGNSLSTTAPIESVPDRAISEKLSDATQETGYTQEFVDSVTEMTSTKSTSSDKVADQPSNAEASSTPSRLPEVPKPDSLLLRTTAGVFRFAKQLLFDIHDEKAAESAPDNGSEIDERPVEPSTSSRSVSRLMVPTFASAARKNAASSRVPSANEPQSPLAARNHTKWEDIGGDKSIRLESAPAVTNDSGSAQTGEKPTEAPLYKSVEKSQPVMEEVPQSSIRKLPTSQGSLNIAAAMRGFEPMDTPTPAVMPGAFRVAKQANMKLTRQQLVPRIPSASKLTSSSMSLKQSRVVSVGTSNLLGKLVSQAEGTDATPQAIKPVASEPELKSLVSREVVENFGSAKLEMAEREEEKPLPVRIEAIKPTTEAPVRPTVSKMNTPLVKSIGPGTSLTKGRVVSGVKPATEERIRPPSVTRKPITQTGPVHTLKAKPTPAFETKAKAPVLKPKPKVVSPKPETNKRSSERAFSEKPTEASGLTRPLLAAKTDSEGRQLKKPSYNPKQSQGSLMKNTLVHQAKTHRPTPQVEGVKYSTDSIRFTSSNTAPKITKPMAPSASTVQSGNGSAFQAPSILKQPHSSITPSSQQRRPPIVAEPVEDLPNIMSESEDDDDGNVLQDWANSPQLREMLVRQQRVDPDSVFGPIAPLHMDEVFRSSRVMRPRSSSANWSGQDRLTVNEVEAYASQMGYKNGQP